MKKIALLLLLFINLSCEKEVLVEQEIKKSLINITPETNGNCSNGGYKIETGIDTNNNGILDSNEVQSTNFICNGTNGDDGNEASNSLLNINNELEGDNCENGGYKLETGVDTNNNGILDSNEIQSINFICNGTDGNNGYDGSNSLLNINNELEGDNCENGGYKIETGIDTNHNGILDSNEVQSTNFICNSSSNNPQNGKNVTQDFLTDGNILEINDFPYHLKKGLSMSFYTDINLVGSISYGKGFNKYRGEYLTIDNTNIYYYYDSVLQGTKSHGLAISTFLKSSFYIDDSSTAHVILQSLTGTFQTTFQFRYEMNYKAFIKSDGQDASNINLSCVSKEFQNSIWAFGDSYFGVSPSRWPGKMKDFGYFNFMINGLAGQSSEGAYADFERSLIYGTPKYLLWCLGMNDNDTNYQKYLNMVIDKCTELDITLVLTTIPTVPTRNKETIKSIVKSSGYRYVDFYKAMGANEKGNWYSGYLNIDGIHPNEIGADALAGQVLVDFPELMQYGKTF